MSEIKKEWNCTTVKQVCTFYKGGDSFRKKEYTEDGIPVLTKGDLNPYGVVNHGGERFAPKSYNESKDYRLTQPGELLLTSRDLSQTGEYLGIVAPVPENGPYFVNQGANFIRLNDEIDNRFFVYWTHSKIYRQHVTSRAVGSTQVHLRKDDFLNAPLWLPPLPIQRRIADILGALDDKIELNRRMNETLEEMAQALYQHWFVDFGPFQDREFKDTEELGAIPKGWDVKPAYDLCDVLTGGTPKTKKDEYWGGDIKWVSAKDISDTGTFVMDTERKVTPTGVEESTTDVLPERTVVVVARGSVGKHCIIGEDMAMNQSCYGLRGREEIGQSWTYLMLNNLIRRLQQVAYGSVFDTITISTFKNTEIVAPPVEIISRFEEKVDPLFDLMHSNVKENQTLAKTRDYLLPKLISGEIEVDAVEKAVETSV